MNDNDGEAPCPFCGHDCWGEGGFDDVCEHFVAEWAAQVPEEPSVLSQPGSTSAFAPASDLATACDELQAIVGEDEEDPGWDARYELLENALPPDRRPTWWSDLCAAVRGQAETDPDYAARDSAWHATWIMAALLDEAPGLAMRNCLLGGNNMGGAGYSWFAWSKRPGGCKQRGIGPHRCGDTCRPQRRRHPV